MTNVRWQVRAIGVFLASVAIAILLNLTGLLSGLGAATPISHSVQGLALVENVQAADKAGIDQAQAESVALRKAPEVNARLHGYTVTSSYHSFGLLRAADQSGRAFFTSPAAVDAWVVQISAPAQSGWHVIQGVVVINAQTSQVEAASIETHV